MVITRQGDWHSTVASTAFSPIKFGPCGLLQAEQICRNAKCNLVSVVTTAAAS